MCGPHRHFVPLPPRTLRRIPQAVGAVATLNMYRYHDFETGFQYRKR